MSSPAYLTRVAPEIRLMIYKELIQSLLSRGSTWYFHSSIPYYHLILHGTSPFVGYETVQKQGPNLWALLRVCKLFHREVQPLLDDLAPNIVYDFRYFLHEDMEAWVEAAGEHRIAQMRRWMTRGVLDCLGSYIDNEEPWTDGDEDWEEDDEERELYDEAYEAGSMFHGYTITAQLDQWAPGQGVDEFDMVFHAWDWDTWGYGHDSCFQGVEEPLVQEVSAGYRQQWEELGKAVTTADLLEAAQCLVSLDRGRASKARKDWTAFVRRLKNGDQDDQSVEDPESPVDQAILNDVIVHGGLTIYRYNPPRRQSTPDE